MYPKCFHDVEEAREGAIDGGNGDDGGGGTSGSGGNNVKSCGTVISKGDMESLLASDDVMRQK